MNEKFLKTLDASWAVILCCLILVVSIVVVYRNAFYGPFIFDDLTQIIQNSKIQSLQWPWTFLENNRRPVLYLTLAINFAQYGFNAIGFHAFNIRVHAIAAIFLFLIVRRTLLRFEHVRQANLHALAVAVLWAVHPLHTQAVTYIIQRAESLMGMFFLASVFFALKYFDTQKAGWLITCAFAGLLCALTKEVALVLPIMILFYDRVFVSGTFRSACKKHTPLYVALGFIWVVMFVLYFTTRPEHRLTAGFGLEGLSPWDYLINQPRAIIQYLFLAVWPNPLVFDYEWQPVFGFSYLWPMVAALAGLIGMFTFYFFRRPWFGFLGLGFFVLLAPSSSFIPLRDLIFEYRMYLALALIMVAIVFLCKGIAKGIGNLKNENIIFVVLVAMLSLAWGGMTYQRNQVYLSEETLWKDVIHKRPENSRAYNNLGEYYLRKGQDRLAKSCFLQSIQLNNTYPDVFGNLATVFAKEKNLDLAITFAKSAIELDPEFAVAYNNLGSALSQQGKYEQSIPYFQKTLELGFGPEGVFYNLAVAYLHVQNVEHAIKVLQWGLQIHPESNQIKSLLAEIYTQKKPK